MEGIPLNQVNSNSNAPQPPPSSPPSPPPPPPPPSSPPLQPLSSLVLRRFRKSRLLSFHLLMATALTIITTWYTYQSRYRGIQSTSHILPPKPYQAIIIVQLLMILSVRYVAQCFLTCCDWFRWTILAASSTDALSFYVLAALTGFCALAGLVAARLGGGWAQKWRLLALCRLLVLHVILPAAQLVWLIRINPQTVYGPGKSTRDWISRPGFGTGVGEFTLLQGRPLPFSAWRVWGYLSDSTRVREIEPQNCSADTDLHCAAYVLFGYPSLIVPNPDLRARDGKETAVIIKDVPAYVVEFSSGNMPVALDDAADPWRKCVNYTTAIGSTIRSCMGLSSSPDRSSRVAAGWAFCLKADNCTEVYNYVNGSDAYNNTVFRTNMDIRKSDISAIIDMYNGTIIDVYSIGKPIEYPVDQSDFFTAFTAPFNHTPVNVDGFLEVDYLDSIEEIQSFDKIFRNKTSPSELKAINDAFLDSVIYSFISPLPSEPPALHLRGFLSDALASNSAFYFEPIEPQPVRQTYVLNVNPVSLFMYTGLNLVVLLVSVSMLYIYPSRRLPHMALFPELTFARQLEDDAVGLLRRNSNMENIRHLGYSMDADGIQVELRP